MTPMSQMILEIIQLPWPDRHPLLARKNLVRSWLLQKIAESRAEISRTRGSITAVEVSHL